MVVQEAPNCDMGLIHDDDLKYLRHYFFQHANSAVCPSICLLYYLPHVRSHSDQMF